MTGHRFDVYTSALLDAPPTVSRLGGDQHRLSVTRRVARLPEVGSNVLVASASTDPHELLSREFPSLRIESVEPLGEGWDHVAYLVNDEIVFRLPRELIEGTEVAPGRGAEREVGLLRRIEQAVTVEAGQRIGLEQFHGVPQDLAQAHRALGSTLVSPQVRSAAESAMATCSDRWRTATARRMAVLHADLGLDHLLLDAQGDVYALIDWSDACIAPPEHQLSTLMWHIPELVRDVTAGYAATTGERPDIELIFADGYLNALADLGELLEEGTPEDDEGIERCVRFLDGWSERGTGWLTA